MKKIFMTGSTGFLGRTMLKQLLKDSYDQFYLLIRSASSKKFLKKWLVGVEPHRIRYIQGDVIRPYFGLSDANRKTVLSCTDYWHLAASTSFDDKNREEIYTTNIKGTAGIIDLAKECDNLRHLYYVSTAYIAGRNQSVILEDEMPERNGFKNIYEESKYDSEELIRQSDLPFTLFRPSIIIGNSKTGDHMGETRMVYGYLLGIFFSVIKSFGNKEGLARAWNEQNSHEVKLRLLGYPEITKNLICIDDVVGMIMEILKSDHTRKTYNLVNDGPLLMSDCKYIIEQVLRVRGIEYVGGVIDNPNQAEKRALRLTDAYMPYCVLPDPKWDTTNTDKALGDYKKVTMTPEKLRFMMEMFVQERIIEKHLTDNFPHAR